MNLKCKICGSNNLTVRFNDKIRVGKFGNLSDQKRTIYICDHCQVAFLDEKSIDYETQAYRDLVETDSSADSYYKAHDSEQLERMSVLGLDNIRGKTIADIGCGAGSFIDLLKGYAEKTIAVEPAKHFHKFLLSKGHDTYSYTEEALIKWRNEVDIISCFAVIEHLENPLKFLKSLKSLLKPNGFILLSTPNLDDWLLELLPKEYGRFFFRHVHLWYFNKSSMKNLASKVNLRVENVIFKQRFDLSNAFIWASEHRPSGLQATDLLSDIDTTYRDVIEKMGKSDYVYFKLRA